MPAGDEPSSGPPKRRRVTMADVGRLAGVSSSTVSFVLNDTKGQTISPETRERVLNVVAELDYRPNRTARGLRTRRAATIGLVTDEIAAEPFAAAAILGAHEMVWADGSLLLVVNTTRSERIVREVVDELVDRPVDAILFTVTGTRRLVVPDVLKGVPALVVNGFAGGDVIPAVLPDEVTGGRCATELLIAAGHRRIAYLTGSADAWPTRARLRGFAAALEHAGLSSTDQVVRAGNYLPDSGYDLTRRLLTEPDLPTAIMCGNDRMAIGVYLALSEAGLRVPQDMSVVGYDDQIDLAARLHPPLSTVELPCYQMGRWAGEQVVAGTIARLPARTYLPCPPVRRQSVAAPRTGPAAVRPEEDTDAH
jgi:LacI family transcriptional regulator, galactose operon repressor